MNNMTAEEKKRRFRELAQHDWRIRTARQLAEELEQPFLIDVEKYSARPKKGVFRENSQNSTHQDARRRVFIEGPL
jgi:hypothetical protein